MSKPRSPKKSSVEKRLETGARLIKTFTGKPDQPVCWMYTDNGRNARADVCERLLDRGVLAPLGDGLFPEMAQTFALAEVSA